MFGFPRQNCTLPSSWFSPLAVALPFVFPSSFSSSALSLLPLLLCRLLLLPALLPSGWRVSMVCNDSVLSAGFQIDTPDTLGRTCLHAAAAGGWGSERSALIFENEGPYLGSLHDGSRVRELKLSILLQQRGVCEVAPEQWRRPQ